MSSDGKPKFDRSSSFARSFFQAGDGDEGGDDADKKSVDVEPRRRSRRLSAGGPRISGEIMASAAATAAVVGEDEPTGNLPHLGDSTKDRQNSWYTDAIAQGGEEIAAMLGHVKDESQEGNGVPDEDEVLEQYRIMAHMEASMRVQENTGFDMTEYEKRRKLLPDSGKKGSGDYSKKPKPRLLPEPRKATSRAQMKPEEPPLPPPRANRRFLEQRTPRVPELCAGIVVRASTTNLPAGEHVVRCLGCRTQLRVNMLANLVSCPECHTVSPASSTRR